MLYDFFFIVMGLTTKFGNGLCALHLLRLANESDYIIVVIKLRLMNSVSSQS